MSAGLPQDMSSPDAAAVLQERARVLARARTTAVADEGTEMVRFRRGDQAFLVELSHVRGVFRPTRTTRLTHAPPPAVALTVWSGDLLILADITAGTRRAARITTVVVLGAETAVVGIAADVVQGIERVTAGRVHPLPHGSADSSFVRGVTDDVASVIDVQALLRTFAGSTE